MESVAVVCARSAHNFARENSLVERVFARQGQLEKAVEDLQRAARLRPGESEIPVELGSVLARAGRLGGEWHYQEPLRLLIEKKQHRPTS